MKQLRISPEMALPIGIANKTIQPKAVADLPLFAREAIR
jgi:hypothetical protein